MAKISRVVGSTSNVLTVFIQDSTSTTGAGLTGLAYNTASLTCYYKRNTATESTSVSLANITTLGTFVSGGFKEVDSTNMPGVYEFDPPNAAFASGASSVAFLLKGAANMVACPIEIELTGVDNQNSVTGGMSALPAAAAGGSGGVYVIGGTGVTVATNNDKTGYSLAAAGLDSITIEAGANARQALSIVFAAAGGVMSGASNSSSNTIVFKGGGVATTRISATTDRYGNRSAVTLTLPS